MSQENRTTMDPEEREAMDSMEWSRGFDNDERPEGSTAENDEVLHGPASAKTLAEKLLPGTDDSE